MTQPTDNADGQRPSEAEGQATERSLPFMLCGLLALFFVIGVIMRVIPAGRRTSEFAECSNHLRAIAIALDNYHSAAGSFPPPQFIGPDGTAWHSWRVFLRPYFELHGLGGPSDDSPFVNDEPWNSPGWLAKGRMVYDRAAYTCPLHGSDKPNTTSYVAIVGPETAWPGGESVRIKDITDGSAFTILVVEIPGCDIYWTEPRDLDFDGLETALKEHGSLRVLCVDGHVGTIHASIPRDQLRALVTIAGGEEIEPEYRP